MSGKELQTSGNQFVNTNQVMQIVDSIAQTHPSFAPLGLPRVTPTNISDIAGPILSSEYSQYRESFLDVLVRKVTYQFFWARTYKNKFWRLKTGANPLGGDVEEDHVNPLEEGDSGNCGTSTLLDSCPPDVASVMHTLNRRARYCVSIHRQRLASAFTSWRALTQFINGIISQLYSSNEIGEQQWTQDTFASAYQNNGIVKIESIAVTDEDSAKALAKQIMLYSLNFTEYSTDYNSYAQFYGRAPRTTWTPFENQVLVIRNDVLTELTYELLAWAFNLSVAEIKVRTIAVRNIGDPSIQAVLMDEAYLQIYDTLKEVRDFKDGSNLCDKWWFHIWQTYDWSPFANAVAFTTENITAPVIEGVTVTPSTVSITQGGTSQFSATVTGTGDIIQSVSWSVNSVSGVTISSDGLLSVASTVASGTELTVRATSTQDNTKFGTSTATVVAPESETVITPEMQNVSEQLNNEIQSKEAYLGELMNKIEEARKESGNAPKESVKKNVGRPKKETK